MRKAPTPAIPPDKTENQGHAAPSATPHTPLLQAFFAAGFLAAGFFAAGFLAGAFLGAAGFLVGVFLGLATCMGSGAHGEGF